MAGSDFGGPVLDRGIEVVNADHPALAGVGPFVSCYCDEQLIIIEFFARYELPGGLVNKLEGVRKRRGADGFTMGCNGLGEGACKLDLKPDSVCNSEASMLAGLLDKPDEVPRPALSLKGRIDVRVQYHKAAPPVDRLSCGSL
jgi:hypothetical protein